MNDDKVLMLDYHFTLTNNCEYANIFDEMSECIKNNKENEAFQLYIRALKIMETSTAKGE